MGIEMKTKKYIIVGFLVVLLLAAAVFFVFWMRPQIALNNFSRLIKTGNLDDLSLTIYYNNPYLLTLYPWTVDDLTRGEKIVITGSDIEEHIDLLKQIGNVSLKPVWKKTSYVDVRIYYVFETEKKGKIFDVAMWGGDEDGSIYVNGVEVKGTDIFYDVMIPFLPDDAVKTLEEYLGRGNQG